MTNSPLRWGLLSTARINQALIPPLRSSKRNVLTAVASRSQETADAYARENKIERAFGSYEAMLSDPDIDVVYNSLPNHLHAEWTIKAVEAGKHVLVEKPIALSVPEVDAIAAAAQKHGRVVAEAFMYRHHPQTIEVINMAQGGRLGKIQLVRGAFGFNFSREENYRLDPSQGGGALWDVGCYPLSYARAVFGTEPLEVFGWQVTGTTGIDESFIAQLRFPGEVYAQFTCSFAMTFHATMELIGTEGLLNIPVPYKPGEDEHILFTHPNNTTEAIPVAGQVLYSGEVEDIADAVLLGKAPRVSLADSRANVTAILALLESARAGKPVTL